MKVKVRVRNKVEASKLRSRSLAWNIASKRWREPSSCRGGAEACRGVQRGHTGMHRGRDRGGVH